MFLNYFAGQINLTLTEIDPEAIGYDHYPSELWAVLEMGEGETFRMVNAQPGELGDGDGTLRLIRRMDGLPRAYTVVVGRIRVHPADDGSFEVEIDCVLASLEEDVSEPIIELRGVYRAALSGMT